jgi:hypothetical protein
MPDKIMELSKTIGETYLTNEEGRRCYPSSTGAYRALLSNICIDVGVWGSEEVKSRVTKTLENHLKYLQENS